MSFCFECVSFQSFVQNFVPRHLKNILLSLVRVLHSIVLRVNMYTTSMTFCMVIWRQKFERFSCVYTYFAYYLAFDSAEESCGRLLCMYTAHRILVVHAFRCYILM